MTDETNGRVEEWRVITGHENYEVSNLGRVRSWIHSGKFPTRRTQPRYLTPVGGDSHIYPVVTLSNRKTRMVHSLVAEAFLGPRPDGYEVNHRDGNKANSAVDNLEYVTPSQNSRHAIRMGLAKPLRGERHYAAKLTSTKVVEIRQSSEPCSVLAKRFGVTEGAVRSVRDKRSWKHIDTDIKETP